jgi:hypothetical protein
MGKHRRTSQAAWYVRAVHGEGLTKAPQNVSLGRMTGGMVALAIVLGGLGAEAAAAAHVGGEHNGAGQKTGSGSVGASRQLADPGVVGQRPWMY